MKTSRWLVELTITDWEIDYIEPPSAERPPGQGIMIPEGQEFDTASSLKQMLSGWLDDIYTPRRQCSRAVVVDENYRASVRESEEYRRLVLFGVFEPVLLETKDYKKYEPYYLWPVDSVWCQKTKPLNRLLWSLACNSNAGSYWWYSESNYIIPTPLEKRQPLEPLIAPLEKWARMSRDLHFITARKGSPLEKAFEMLQTGIQQTEMDALSQFYTDHGPLIADLASLSYHCFFADSLFEAMTVHLEYAEFLALKFQTPEQHEFFRDRASAFYQAPLFQAELTTTEAQLWVAKLEKELLYGLERVR